MHNKRMEKQTKIINTFKMTLIFHFFIFKSYLTVKRTFLGDLDFVQNKSLPNCFVTRKHYKTRYYMILCDFYLQSFKFSFLDGGHFGGNFEFINPQIFEVETKIVFNLSKPCSVPNLKLVSIWDT